jgi:hypothetical protein
VAGPCEFGNVQVPYRARNLAMRVTVKVSKDTVPMIANNSHGGTSFLVYVLNEVQIFWFMH